MRRRILAVDQHRYAGGILPDHMPSHPGDPGKLQAFAFGYGYIQALINGVNSEVS
jgi:mannonate dehydratase